ncbi:MAG: hypothetical protein J6E38_08755 [Clostridia bacterium]|nr:hypothetical protein [Clostridia bacterium]
MSVCVSVNPLELPLLFWHHQIKYVTYGGGNFVIFDKGNGAVLRFGESE